VIYLNGSAVLMDTPNIENSGYMITPNRHEYVEVYGIAWGADTGCFTQPHTFSMSRYIDWLTDRKYAQDSCLFATAPDVVGDAVATLEISREPLQEIRGLGYKSALVAQDGLEKLSIPWDTFDCLFIGGTTDWKLSEPAYALTTEAKRRGKWAHMGRVNSFRRIVAASISGYDSVDGTFLAYGPDLNIIRLKSWLDKLNKQPSLIRRTYE
jgi:hypothetical protein